MAIWFWTALRLGPVHFTGRPLVNDQVFTGFCCSSCRVTTPSFRTTCPLTKPKCHCHNSSDVAIPRLSRRFDHLMRVGNRRVKPLFPPSLYSSTSRFISSPVHSLNPPEA